MKTIKRKKHPQFFIDSMGVKKTLYVIVENGMVQDVVKVACPSVNVEIHDYDIQGEDSENVFLDRNGREFRKIELE